MTTTELPCSRTTQRGGAARALASFTSLLAAALVPKCPLCVAALLSALGLGAGSASLLAPWLRPFVLGTGGVAILSLVWSERRRLRRLLQPQMRGRAASRCHCSVTAALGAAPSSTT